jgi:L-rhamnose mutarotase
MTRKAFKMTLYPNELIEYTKSHNPIWHELKEVLKNHGVRSYSIFFDEDTSTLFDYAEIESEEKRDAIVNTAICKKWWKYMSDIMETNPDNSPVSQTIKSVFYLK